MRLRNLFLISLLIVNFAQAESITNTSNLSPIELREKIFEQEQKLRNEQSYDQNLYRIERQNAQEQILLNDKRALNIQEQINQINLQETRNLNNRKQASDENYSNMTLWTCTFNIVNNTIYRTTTFANSVQNAVDQVFKQVAAWGPTNIVCNM